MLINPRDDQAISVRSLRLGASASVQGQNLDKWVGARMALPLERTIMLLMRSLVYSPWHARRGACIAPCWRAHPTTAWEFAAARPPVPAGDRHGGGECAPPQRWTLSGGPSDRRGGGHIGCSACLVPAKPRPPASRSSNVPRFTCVGDADKPAAPGLFIGTSRARRSTRRGPLGREPTCRPWSIAAPFPPLRQAAGAPLWARLLPARHHFEEDQ
jgi:hypothetical protein